MAAVLSPNFVSEKGQTRISFLKHFLNLMWGSSNYRPSAPFLYEVASQVKKTAIPAIIIINCLT